MLGFDGVNNFQARIVIERVRDNRELNNFIASQTALGRVGLPDDIGAAVTVLLSDDSGWINGQRVEVSGGMFL